MIEVFTPSFADDSNTNAQNLTVKEVVARLSPDRFRVSILCHESSDPRISQRPNTRLLKWGMHGNAARILLRCLIPPPDVYFYPREGPLDEGFLWLRRRFGLPTAVITHVVSGGFDRPPIRKSLLRNIQEADAVFANNTYLAELVERQTAVATSVIYNGIDRRFFFPSAAAGKGTRGLTVVYAGSFRPYKRVDLVVREAERWPQVSFRIAGGGDEEASCRQLAARLVSANVHFLGHVPLERLAREMRSADIFLFPSDCEGHPQVLGQAAACGLPCIAMNSYRPDYVRNGVTGFLVDSVEELSSKLGLLLCDAQLRAAMSTAAIEWSRKFDWDGIAQQWEQVFETAVAERKRPERKKIKRGNK